MQGLVGFLDTTLADLQLLVGAGYTFNDNDFVKIFSEGNGAAIEFLLPLFGDLNRELQGFSSLYWTAFGGNREMVEHLLAAGLQLTSVVFYGVLRGIGKKGTGDYVGMVRSLLMRMSIPREELGAFIEMAQQKLANPIKMFPDIINEQLPQLIELFQLARGEKLVDEV